MKVTKDNSGVKHLDVFRIISKSSLTWQTIKYIILFSAIFTFFATAVQLLQYYKEDVGLINSRLKMIEQSYLKPLSISLWEVDKERIKTQLKSILSLDDIEFVELRERTHELSFSMGNKSAEKVITRQFPLLYNLSDSEKISLGELCVIATTENAYHRIFNKVLLILGTQMVKTFCVSFGIFYIIYFFITRHFSTIANYSKSLTLNSLDLPLILNRKQSENTDQDELSQIVSSLNYMRLSLKEENAEREKIEMELRDNRNLFLAIFQQAAVGVAQIDTKTGSFLTINQRYCEIVGYSQEEMRALTFMKLSHPDDMQAGLDCMHQLMKGEIDRFSIEKRYVHKKGSIIWVNLNVSSMWEKGEYPEYHIAVIEDITERKLSEENLHYSQLNLDEAVKAGNVGLWNWDLKTNKVHYSAEWKKQIGYKDNEIRDDFSEWEKRVHPDDLQQTTTAVEKSIEDINQDHRTEFRFQHKDGSYRWILAQASFILNEDGHPAKMLGTHIDITKRKELEAQLHQAQKMESIGTLAGGIAHDFNNILSSIIGFSELALDGVEKGTELEDELQEVITAGLRAKDLIKQILTFARQADEKMKPIQVNAIVKEVLKLIKSSIPATIQINENINSDSFIMGSPTQIHQILMNLCTNASQAMETDGGILDVSLDDVTIDGTSAILKLKHGDYIKLTVKDNGMGISPKDINSIFDPYFTTKAMGEGTGMGLAVVHGIIESYSGKITVDSSIQKGTSFSVYLPISKKRILQPASELTMVPHGDEHILFVDDEAAIVRMGERVLQRLGYTVTSRTSSIEALELFRSKPQEFDLVLSDITMPTMNGDKLAVELMKIRPDIPVILCTGYSKKISEEIAAEKAVKAFAYKPIMKADLARTIRKILNEAKG